jgi:hypothetical protein
MKGFSCNPKALLVTKVISLFTIITVALSSFVIGPFIIQPPSPCSI